MARGLIARAPIARAPIARAPIARVLSGLVAVAALSGCALFQPEVGEATWRAYLAGDDLRMVCAEGVPDHYRAVFHDAGGDGQEPRLRTFEIAEDREEGGAVIAARVLSPGDMAGTTIDDAYQSWRGVAASLRVGARAFTSLVVRLDRVGAFLDHPLGAPPRPQRLGWLITGCRGGEWFWNAFADPADIGLEM